MATINVRVREDTAALASEHYVGRATSLPIIPPEIFLLILDESQEMTDSEYKATLSSLSCACRMFRDIFQPLLFSVLEWRGPQAHHGSDWQQKHTALLEWFARLSARDERLRGLTLAVKRCRIRGWIPDRKMPDSLQKVFRGLGANARHFRNLRALTLESLPISASALQAIHAMPQLKELVVERVSSPRGDQNYALRSPRHILTSLRIRGVSPYCKFPVAATQLVDMDNVRRLEVDWRCVTSLSHRGEDMPRLTELHIDDAVTDDDNWQLLISLFRRMPALQILTVASKQRETAPQLTPNVHLHAPRGLHTLCGSMELARLLMRFCPIRHLDLGSQTIDLEQEDSRTFDTIFTSTAGPIESLKISVGALHRPLLVAHLQNMLRSLTITRCKHIPVSFPAETWDLPSSLPSVMDLHIEIRRCARENVRMDEIILDLQGQRKFILDKLVPLVPSVTSITFAGLIQWRKADGMAACPKASQLEPVHENWHPTILNRQSAKDVLSGIIYRRRTRRPVTTDFEGCLVNLVADPASRELRRALA